MKLEREKYLAYAKLLDYPSDEWRRTINDFSIRYEDIRCY
jgi:hypothetical protein